MSGVKRMLGIIPRMQTRNVSTSEKFIDLSMDGTTGITKMTLNRPPVNSLSYSLLEEMYQTLDNLEKDNSNGLILTSYSSTVFTAGLDIMEFYGTSAANVTRFWKMLQDVALKLNLSSYPTVAAINGHSPAGGCMLSLACEYRVMLPNFTIGLNEAKLGIIPPEWIQESLTSVIGGRQAEMALLTGTMFLTEEALRVGLIDKIALDREDLEEVAKKFLLEQSKLPANSRRLIKTSYRKGPLKHLIHDREQDAKRVVDFIMQKEVQGNIERYLKALKEKK